MQTGFSPYIRGPDGVFDEKNRGRKSRDTVPIRNQEDIKLFILLTISLSLSVENSDDAYPDPDLALYKICFDF
jgi:hypothetical protein